MRHISKIFIILGITLFVLLEALGFILSLIDRPYNKTLQEYEMIFSFVLPYVAYTSIFFGLVLRLFSSTTHTTQQNKIGPEVNLTEGKDFNFWRRANIFGFGFWLLTSMSIVMLFDSGPSLTAYVILGLQQLALPVAGIFFFLGIKKGKVDLRKAAFYLKIPFYYGLLAITIISILYFSGNDIGRKKHDSVTQLPGPSINSSIKTSDESSQPETELQPEPFSNSSVIKIVSPNGGEILKIGDKVEITWEANPTWGGWLDLELFEISGDIPNIASNGQCLNCVGGGLRSGIRALSPITSGIGKINWEVGRLYSGGYVQPGSHYILKASMSKTGSTSECPTRFAGCTIDLGADWSDAVFSLIN